MGRASRVHHCIVVVNIFNVGQNHVQIQRPFLSDSNVIHHDWDIQLCHKKLTTTKFQANQGRFDFLHLHCGNCPGQPSLGIQV